MSEGSGSGAALSGINALYVEEQLRLWRADPSSVDASWREYFEGAGAELAAGEVPAAGPGFARRSIFDNGGGAMAAGADPAALEYAASQGRIFQLINAYRVRGHLHARLDPLDRPRAERHRELDPDYWGFTERDWDRTFDTVFLKGPTRLTLRELHAYLEETYSRTIGVEFMHIHEIAIKEWLQERFERTRNRCQLDKETMLAILEKLSGAEAFEDFLHTKYRGAKRFSLEGAESMISTLHLMIEDGAARGVHEVVLGMAHRGRLNVLINILGKEPRWVFREFDDLNPMAMWGRGDVKYHLGHSADLETRLGDRVHLSLTFNPSHLEFVNPVVQGRVRAKQDRQGDEERKRCLPILIHGDAAFIGQGVVAETFNMAHLPGYSAGGTIHLIVNNQIGFTTEPEESRSTAYCTALARMTQVPVIHVNGEDPEAVVHAARVAVEFRQTWGRDVVIDMYCFRRYGHNEGDEPTFTQPAMYRDIAIHPAVHEVYGAELVGRGLVSQQEVDEIYQGHVASYEAGLEHVRRRPVTVSVSPAVQSGGGFWKGFQGGPDAMCPRGETAIALDRFHALVRATTRVPDEFHLHRKLQRLLKARRRALEHSDAQLDWGMGEILAYASLLWDGHPVRMTGQDIRRGTFSHRHAVFVDFEDGHRYSPLDHLHEEQGPFDIHNSPLSEAAVLGFEWGYSLDSPEGLVLWEAQFGDFANSAQVIIDQFLCAAEDKWNRLSGLAVLLPHGYEGQGPEHSSARLERWLQLCAEDNMQVCNVTTPAQMFHMLRRQVVRSWRKPLIVMTPKSLLRHKRAVSPIDAFTHGRFHRLIPEAFLPAPGQAERAILCSGKVFYDLLARREAEERTDTVLMRLEQLYPLPEAEIVREIGKLPALREIVWCQEEPANMGARNFLHPHFTRLFEGGPALRWVCREASASPATGSHKAHHMEQADLLDRAFGKGAA